MYITRELGVKENSYGRRSPSNVKIIVYYIQCGTRSSQDIREGSRVVKTTLYYKFAFEIKT